MILRIPQRTNDDCAVCVVAMVMGAPYTYERVAEGSREYLSVAPGAKFSAWWEAYLSKEGFRHFYCQLEGLGSLPLYGGSVLGILGMDIPRLNAAHVVAVDETGVVDPAEGAPSHVPVGEYVELRRSDGCVFHKEWLAVCRPGQLGLHTHTD